MGWTGVSLSTLRLVPDLAFFSTDRTDKLTLLAPSGHTSPCRVACAAFGGPIASTRDERQVVIVTADTVKPHVLIHTASGGLLSRFAWERGSIVGLGWSRAEELLIVESSGEVGSPQSKVRMPASWECSQGCTCLQPLPTHLPHVFVGHMQVTMFEQHGTKLPRQFSMGEDCQRDGILDCHVYPDGLVAITRTFAVWSISSIQNPRPQQLASPKISQPPYCMAVVDPRYTLSGTVEVSLPTDADEDADGRLYLMRETWLGSLGVRQ